jgi:hypothetical protein
MNPSAVTSSTYSTGCGKDLRHRRMTGGRVGAGTPRLSAPASRPLGATSTTDLRNSLEAAPVVRLQPRRAPAVAGL